MVYALLVEVGIVHVQILGGGEQNWHLLRFNPLNADLNHICHLLALLGAHHIFHVSGLRVNPFLNTTIEIFKNILHSLSHISRSFGLPVAVTLFTGSLVITRADTVRLTAICVTSVIVLPCHSPLLHPSRLSGNCGQLYNKQELLHVRPHKNGRREGITLLVTLGSADRRKPNTGISVTQRKQTTLTANRRE